jgi:hypothetical protein
MTIRGFSIEKGTVGASTSNAEDNVCGLLANGVAVIAAGSVTGVVLNTAYLITKVKDAETMGINAAYDTTNHTLIYRHITEFYRMAGEGTKLWIMICAAAKTMKEMIEESGKLLIVASSGSIYYLTVGFNPPNAYAPVLVDGLETIVREAIAPAQDLHDWSWDTDRPVNIILEGRGINGTVVSTLDLRNIPVGAAVLKATHVTLCVGQDWDFAETLAGVYQKYADIGTLLGTKASISVNRSVAEVETLDISSATKAKWLTAGLSNHSKISALDADLADYDDKGYVFGMSYTGISGYRWNNDHVCSPEEVDDDGFMAISTIGHGATINKAARMLRKKLLPKVKSTVPVDATTGLLPTGVIKYFEGLGDVAFKNMSRDGEISDGKTTVDPASNLLSGDKQLNVSFVVVPTATIGKIKGVINLKTTL